MERYFQVHGYNRSNFATFDSPKFGTYSECKKWINEHVFDTGMRLEIREVKTTPVEYSDYEKFDVVKMECDRIDSKILWDRGCLKKSSVKLKNNN